MNRVCWIRFFEVTYQSEETGVFRLYTDIPGPGLAEVAGAATVLPVAAGRQEFRIPVPGTTRARLLYPEITPNAGGTLRLYKLRAFVRSLPNGEWQWITLPVVPETSEWIPVKLPIPPTPEEFSPVKLPIPPTPEEFSPVKLPITPSDEVSDWQELPVDAVVPNA